MIPDHDHSTGTTVYSNIMFANEEKSDSEGHERRPLFWDIWIINYQFSKHQLLLQPVAQHEFY